VLTGILREKRGKGEGEGLGQRGEREMKGSVAFVFDE